MPKIRRWFHVSHDINSDPEVIELTDTFGLTGLKVWLELLSIGDRNEGNLPELSHSTVRQLSIKCNSTVTRVSLVCDWCLTRTWVVCDPSPRIRNYLLYNDSRERKKLRTASPPTPTPTPTPNHPPYSPPKGDDAFDKFWDSYPRKVGKGAAEKAWKKSKINGELQTVLAAIELQKGSDQWQKNSGEFIPNPATWINQKRWLDEANAPPAATEPYLTPLEKLRLRREGKLA